MIFNHRVPGSRRQPLTFKSSRASASPTVVQEPYSRNESPPRRHACARGPEGKFKNVPESANFYMFDQPLKYFTDKDKEKLGRFSS